MLNSLNYAMNTDALSEDRLKRYFDTFWPALEQVLVQVNRKYQSLRTTPSPLEHPPSPIPPNQ